MAERDFAVMIAHRRAGAAAAAMAEQGDVSTTLEIVYLAMSGEGSELHKMISAAAGSELRPGAVFVLFGHRADIPIGVQDLMLAAILKARADAKTRLGFDGTREAVLVSFQFANRNIEHRHLHATGNINAHRIRNHRVFCRQHSADRQAITYMSIRHQRASH